MKTLKQIQEMPQKWTIKACDIQSWTCPDCSDDKQYKFGVVIDANTVDCTGNDSHGSAIDSSTQIIGIITGPNDLCASGKILLKLSNGTYGIGDILRPALMEPVR